MLPAVFPSLSKEAQMAALFGWFHAVPWLKPRYALRMPSCCIGDQVAVDRVVVCTGANAVIP